MTIEIRFGDRVVCPRQGETVLDSFERSGIKVPSSCRVGVCHFCILKTTSGSVPTTAQAGLDKKLQESGHFKSCVCFPEDSFTCEPAHSASFRDYVKVRSIEPTGHEIVKVTFIRPDGFAYLPGQFATFRCEDGHARSYAIASSNSSEFGSFDIHVRRIPNGKMSNWLHDHAAPGDSLWMEGPKGECTYRTKTPQDDLLLVGTGTGMAPLYGISRDALAHEHRGSISIIQAALSYERLYLTDRFRQLEQTQTNVDYRACVLNGAGSGEVTVTDLRHVALDAASHNKNLRIYLCGDPGLVRYLKKHIFLAGTSTKTIHVDSIPGSDPSSQ